MTGPGRFPGAISLARIDSLCKSKKAQMPFSVVAVLILVLSSASIVLICGMNLKEDGASVSVEDIESMREVASRCSIEFEQTSYGLAIDAVREVGALNESLLRREFESLIRERLAIEYPKLVGGFDVRINESDVSLSFLRMALNDLYPEMTNAGQEATVDWKMSSVPAYLLLTGTFTVEVKSTSGFLARHFEISRELYLPLPLISNRLQALSDALSGGKSEFENIVRYELSALAQERVLRGFGSSSRDGGQGTDEILTKEDVVNAINLAVLLEQGSHLRSFDEDFIMTFVETMSRMGFSEVTTVIDDLKRGGTLDPADLFLRLYGSGRYDLKALLAESLYAFADILVLRWLDYFQVMDVLRFIEETGDSIEIGLTEILGRMLNKDALHESIVNWMRSRLEQSGYPESSYRYVNYGYPNAVVEVPDHRMVFFNHLDEGRPVVLSGIYEVDFPSVDILASDAWKAFYIDYKVQTFELAEALDSFVKSVSIGIASDSSMPEIDISLDPRDRSDYIEELEREVESAILNRESWMAPAFGYAEKSVRLIDSMGESLVRFIDSYWQEIFKRNDSIESVFKTLAGRLVEGAGTELSGFTDEEIEDATYRVYWEIKLSGIWGVKEEVEGAFDAGAIGKVDLFRKVFGNLESPSYLQNALVQVARGAVEGLPGVENLLSGFVSRLITDVGECLKFRADRITVQTPSSEGCRLLSEGGLEITESLDFGFSPSSFGVLGSTIAGTCSENLSIEIKKPWEYPIDSEYYPNRHLTDFGNMTMTPYTSQWEVGFEGRLDTTLVSNDTCWALLMRGDDFEIDSSIPFSAVFTVVVSSCWPLEGVDYRPSATLLGDVVKFLESIWSKIVEGIGFISHGVSKVFSFLQSMFSSLIAFSAKAVAFISNVLQTMVESVRDFFAGLVSDLIGWVAESVSAAFGSISFNITIFGLKFSIETNVLDLSLRSAKDMLKITCSLAAFGATISLSTRFVKLGSGDYDLLANATLRTDRWAVEIIVDPLMKLFNHFVEVKGELGRHVIELTIPEVVQYDQFRLSLSEVPGVGDFLSNIPIPVPGGAASIDAGLDVKYNSPFADNPMINEFEQNPPGADYDREWVEIFNPTDGSFNMVGWTIETAHGIQRIESLGETVIKSHSRMTYVLRGQVLDNGGESKFPLSECAILMDQDGNRVDCTPWTTDYYNDGRTWQRIHDGSDRWVFRDETFDAANSKKTFRHTDVIDIKGILLDCAIDSLAEAKPGNASLTTLGKAARHVIDRVLDRCLDLVSDSILEIRFYVEISIHDITSSAAAGFTLSLVATGEAIEKALRWIGEAVVDAVKGLTNPYSSTSHNRASSSIAEDVYVRASAFGRIGFPRMISGAAEGLQFRMDAVIEANVAFIGGVFGEDLGKGQIDFGVCVSDIPGAMLPLVFGVDSNKLTTLWIFKASIYET
ncbi:MAG: lamin tail domain-containing protein [Methanomassiliicoccales archaeon]|nr:lamin tail domain-containing protein [Methanomassiliicoccales archaeon]